MTALYRGNHPQLALLAQHDEKSLAFFPAFVLNNGGRNSQMVSIFGQLKIRYTIPS